MYVDLSQLKYESVEMKTALSRLEAIAKSDTWVNIVGATGTGKDILARAIHSISKRYQHQFYAINCSENRGDLLRAEMYGHSPRAFTGAAIEGKKGIFELADRGTVFLNEIDDIPRELQETLVGSLEYGFIPVGGGSTIKPDVRIITSSQKNLRDLVDQGKVRLDFYFKILGEPIKLPTLGNRFGDISYLAKLFCEELSRGNNELSPETLRVLENYDWPGNVRELRKVIELAVRAKEVDGLLVPDDVTRYLTFRKENYEIAPDEETIAILQRFGKEGLTIKDIAILIGSSSLKDIEDQVVRLRLTLLDGQKGETARSLGIDPKTLYRIMRRDP